MPYGVQEHVCKDTTESARCLTDGNNYLWASRDYDGESTILTRYGCSNVPSKILDAICGAFDVEIVTEYQPQFWGFDSQEEWDAAWEKIAARRRDEFYDDVMHYVRGEDHTLQVGTNGMVQAEIAKQLIVDHPELALPESKDRLLDAVESDFDRDHAVRLTLPREDINRVLMLSTHEDDLPKA
jgi:hypothetical protein